MTELLNEQGEWTCLPYENNLREEITAALKQNGYRQGDHDKVTA